MDMFKRCARSALLAVPLTAAGDLQAKPETEAFAPSHQTQEVSSLTVPPRREIVFTEDDLLRFRALTSGAMALGYGALAVRVLGGAAYDNIRALFKKES